jgi:hypothetical protein
VLIRCSSIGLIGSGQHMGVSLRRGTARPSTAPGPGPRAGRCAAPAPRTANARRDPGPIVGSVRRLGWGRVHDASRPGAAAPAQLAVVPLDRHSPAGRHARTAPGPACYSRGLATFHSSHRAKVCALPPLCGPARHPEERTRADERAGQTVAQPPTGSDGADRILIWMHPSGLGAKGRVPAFALFRSGVA